MHIHIPFLTTDQETLGTFIDSIWRAAIGFIMEDPVCCIYLLIVIMLLILLGILMMVLSVVSIPKLLDRFRRHRKD